MSLTEADRTAASADDVLTSTQDGVVENPTDGARDEQDAAPIYAEVVAELGDPTTPPA